MTKYKINVNGSPYEVELEDASGSMELLVFARLLAESGSYIREGSPVLVSGRISVRDEKEPQLLCDTVQPLNEEAAAVAPPVGKRTQNGQGQKLYLRISSMNDPQWIMVQRILDMFPGASPTVIVFADTGRRLGTRCLIHDAMVQEMKERLGEKNVVVQSTAE